METLQAIRQRKSTRGFTDVPVSEESIRTLVEAANASPVGMGLFDSIHIAVVRDRDLLDRISQAAVKGTEREGGDIYYGAGAVFVVSSAKQPLEALAYASASCIVQNILLAATDIGLGSVYIFGTAAGFANAPELIGEAGIPDGYAPVASAAVGYPTDEQASLPKRERSVAVGYIGPK
jgi:nitroreductase